jgi:hypothetical protein
MNGQLTHHLAQSLMEDRLRTAPDHPHAASDRPADRRRTVRLQHRELQPSVSGREG